MKKIIFNPSHIVSVTLDGKDVVVLDVTGRVFTITNSSPESADKMAHQFELVIQKCVGATCFIHETSVATDESR